METPRTWTYTELRAKAEDVVDAWRDTFRGLPLIEQGIDVLERLLLQALRLIERLDRLTYPSRWELIEDDSMNPLG